MKGRIALISTLMFVLVALFIAGLTLGSVQLPLGDMVKWIKGEVVAQGTEQIFISRGLRTLTAIVAGASLSLSGWLMQTLFRNPLAGPSVLGISSGASLFVALMVLGGGLAGSALAHHFAIAGAAMSGALIMLLLVVLVSGRFADHVSLLIFGLMAGYVVNAIESLLQFGAQNESLRSFIFWGMGSFASVFEYTTWWIMASVLLISIVVCVAMLPALNVYLLGDDYAQSMGLRIRRFRLILIVLVGVLTGITTAFCGPVAFIGLAVPHVVRLMYGTSDHRTLFFPVLLTGAAMALLCDVITRAPWGGQVLPLNAITCLMGAPVIVFILIRAKEKGAIL
ncbi:MAG: iron ABC transporter permease [Flavobacteriales bacterium]|nr:iron ABC transporter permease [Flavobacteriales bacterium]